MSLLDRLSARKGTGACLFQLLVILACLVPAAPGLGEEKEKEELLQEFLISPHSQVQGWKEWQWTLGLDKDLDGEAWVLPVEFEYGLTSRLQASAGLEAGGGGGEGMEFGEAEAGLFWALLPGESSPLGLSLGMEAEFPLEEGEEPEFSPLVAASLRQGSLELHGNLRQGLSEEGEKSAGAALALGMGGWVATLEGLWDLEGGPFRAAPGLVRGIGEWELAAGILVEPDHDRPVRAFILRATLEWGGVEP